MLGKWSRVFVRTVVMIHAWKLAECFMCLVGRRQSQVGVMVLSAVRVTASQGNKLSKARRARQPEAACAALARIPKYSDEWWFLPFLPPRCRLLTYPEVLILSPLPCLQCLQCQICPLNEWKMKLY